MAYKKETLKKYMDIMHAAMDSARVELDNMPGMAYHNVTISKGNTKIGNVHNVSLAPIVTCGNCSHCSGFCYDIKAALFHTNSVVAARAMNTVIATEHRDAYFTYIRQYIKRRSGKRSHKFFRWHVGGEIIDFQYFAEMVKTAEMFPNWHFWTYTKMHGIVNLYVQKYGRDAIPNNFVIMFSEWDGMPLVNPYNFPVFTCKLKEGNKNHTAEYFDTLWKCPGNCNICKDLNRGCIAGETTYADEH